MVFKKSVSVGYHAGVELKSKLHTLIDGFAETSDFFDDVNLVHYCFHNYEDYWYM